MPDALIEKLTMVTARKRAITLLVLGDTLEARAVFRFGHLDPSMVSPVLATLFVDKVAETVVQLVLVQVVDVQRVIDVISSERSHHQSMDQSELVNSARVYGAMPAGILPLP